MIFIESYPTAPQYRNTIFFKIGEKCPFYKWHNFIGIKLLFKNINLFLQKFAKFKKSVFIGSKKVI